VGLCCVTLAVFYCSLCAPLLGCLTCIRALRATPSTAAAVACTPSTAAATPPPPRPPPPLAPVQIVVNGVAVGNNFERLERYVCASGPANARPAACYDLPEDMRHQG
jgi:hypothetical protein